MRCFQKIRSTTKQMLSEQVYRKYSTAYTMNEIKLENWLRGVYNIPENKNSVTNVFEYDKPTTNYHTTQKPIALLSELIRIYSNKGDTILDMFAGSGSTGVTCKKENRKFIGIEKEEKFFETIKKKVGVNSSRF